MSELIQRFPVAAAAGLALSILCIVLIIRTVRRRQEVKALRDFQDARLRASAARQAAYQKKMDELRDALSCLKRQFDTNPNADAAFRTALWGAVETHVANSENSSRNGVEAWAIRHLEVALEEAQDAVNALNGDYIATPSQSSD